MHEALKTNAEVANAGACFDEKRTKYKTQSKENDDDKAHREFRRQVLDKTWHKIQDNQPLRAWFITKPLPVDRSGG